MDKNVAINNICRATGLAAQIGAFVAILKFKKPRLGLAMSAAGDLVYWAPAVADKKDPTLRHELGIICSTLSVSNLLCLAVTPRQKENGLIQTTKKEPKGESLICLRNLHGCR